MKIAIYGRNIGADCKTSIMQLFAKLQDQQCEILLFTPFMNYLIHEAGLKLPPVTEFTEESQLSNKSIDFMLSIGGDGTFLESVSFVRDKMIPIIGMNTGRLGFLSTIAREEIREAITSILRGLFTVEERSLLQIHPDISGQFSFPFALNEFVVQKSGSSMVTIHAWVNGEFLNSYWADGLIISTPTGSTAYSMSAGGPIATPVAGCFIVTPIAPHNLTMRPIIVPDHCTIQLRTETRSKKILASMDSQAIELPPEVEITLSRAPFSIRTVRLQNMTYFDTLRNKLMWGADRRN
jgi:NAD+ kinase